MQIGELYKLHIVYGFGNTMLHVIASVFSYVATDGSEINGKLFDHEYQSRRKLCPYSTL